MKTVVYEDRILISYGVGLIKKKILLSELQPGEVRDIPIWWGAGIKRYHGGMLYRTNFTKAVEFRRKKFNYISIGSTSPHKLRDIINKQIKKCNK